MGQLRQWWSAKYRLPPNDPRFEAQSVADLLAEVMSDAETREETERQSASPGGGDPVDRCREAKVLPYDRPILTGDPWADEIELAVARGEEPSI